MRLVRVGIAAFVVLAGAVAIVAVVERSWSAAQLRAAVVLSVTQETPVLAWAMRVITDEPLVDETVVGGSPSTIVRPGEGDGPWPAIVFVNGATRDGRHHPKVQRLAHGLARAGFLAVVPDLPGLRIGKITPKTTAATVRVARVTAERPDVQGGRVGFYGVSVGATLALLAAESPLLADRITVVGGEAPWVDLKRIIRLATTGRYDGERYEVDPFVALAIARSLAAGLPVTDGSKLLAHLEAVADDHPDPLAGLGARAHGGGAQALVDLLQNRDPEQFERLYLRLPASVRAGVGALSPIRRARWLRAPVELASAPHDKYFPPAEARALARAAPGVRLTVTSTLDHAVPRPSVADITDLIGFNSFVVRYLRLARGIQSSGPAWIRPGTNGSPRCGIWVEASLAVSPSLEGRWRRPLTRR
jgi:pimeloyl-ACP methyl ester carboxylesterase